METHVSQESVETTNTKLVDLPPEIIIEIELYLSPTDCLNVSCTCRDFMLVLCRSEYLTRKINERVQKRVNDFRKRFDQASKKLEVGRNALLLVNKADVQCLKCYRIPQNFVTTVLGFACAVLEGSKKQLTWRECKKIMGDVNFLRKFLDWSPEENFVNEKLREAIKGMSSGDTEEQFLMQCEGISVIAYALAKWLFGVIEFEEKISRMESIVLERDERDADKMLKLYGNYQGSNNVKIDNKKN